MKCHLCAVLALFFFATDAFADRPTYEVQHKRGIEFARPDGVPLLLDLHLPQGVENPPLVMFIHGGGWKGGDRKRCRIDWIAEHGYAIASIEYRLSQEALFPAQIHDCKGALRWLREHAGEFGYDATRVVVAGSSAGGHLAALMGTSGDVKELEGKTAGNLGQSSRVQGVIDFYGPSDFIHRMVSHPAKTEDPKGSVYKLFGGKVSEKQTLARLASPVTHVGVGDPPFLVLHGTNDKTVFLDQSEILQRAYQSASLDLTLFLVEGAGHGWSKRSEQEEETVLRCLKKWLSPR